MDYSEYKNSRDLAWQVLINERVVELPVKVSQLCRGMGIRVQHYSPTDGNDGLSTIINDQPRIFVSADCVPTRQRFMLMRWYTNNAKRIIDVRGNISYGKIEPKTRKTDGFMALVAAFIVAEIKRDELTYYNMDGDMPDVVIY